MIFAFDSEACGVVDQFTRSLRSIKLESTEKSLSRKQLCRFSDRLRLGSGVERVW